MIFQWPEDIDYSECLIYGRRKLFILNYKIKREENRKGSRIKKELTLQLNLENLLHAKRF